MRWDTTLSSAAMASAAELPVFIPGIAAYVRWQGAGVDPVVRARISLAGPLFGLFAALVSYGVYQSTGHGVWLAVAHTGAWINLLNLIPVMIFDGASAMNALGKQERVAVLVVSLALWALLGENLFLFVALATGYRLYKRDFPAQSSHSTAYYYIALADRFGRAVVAQLSKRRRHAGGTHRGRSAEPAILLLKVAALL